MDLLLSILVLGGKHHCIDLQNQSFGMLSYSLPTLDGDMDSGDFLPSMCEAWVITNHQKSEQKDYHVEDQPGLHSEFQLILGYTVKTLY